VTKNTVQPLLALECVAGVRDNLLELADTRRVARSLLRRVKQEKMEPEEREAASEKSGRLWLDADVFEIRIRKHIQEHGAIDHFRALVLSETRRLPDLLPGLLYRDAWREYYLLRTAARVAWDAGSTEFDAALETARESRSWKELQKARDRIRTARRLKDGYWQRQDQLIAKRARERARRIAMTDEQRAAQSAVRAERRRQSKLKKSIYVSMLDEQPIQTATEAA
jgi:hypothetical protein